MPREAVYSDTCLPMPVTSLQQLRNSDPDFRREEGSVFDTAASAFSSLVQEMQARIVTEVIGHAKDACSKYKAER